MGESSTHSAQHGRIETDFARPGPLAMEGPEGIRYDFNYGCRVQVPVDGWRVRMTDMDTFNVLMDTTVTAHEVVTSRRKYFVRFLLEVFDGERRVFSHAFNAEGKRVVLRMASLALGDSLGWMPVFDTFREQHRCELHMTLGPHLLPLYREGYPRINFVTEAELDALTDTYATYYIGLLKPFSERDHQPTDPRVSNMQDTIAYMLGVPCEERRPNVVVENTRRLIDEPYVCIATQSTAQCKYWNNPRGWPVLIEYLKARGYRVLCIDRDKQYGTEEYMNIMPEGAEDFTGNRPLQERANLLMHADFFVELGSGLSWLAWAVGVPVIMISGFSHPKTEFRNPYRVINLYACNSCFNDTTEQFDSDNFAWCPRRTGSLQRFQCTAVIMPEHVMRVADKLILDHGLLQSAI